MKSTARTWVLGAVGAAGAAAAASAWAHRRWAAGPDPTSGEPLGLAGGDDICVTTRDGAEIVVHVAGPEQGRVIVLGHGWTHDRRIWGSVATRLVERGHRVLAYDQRGHGASSVGADGLTLEALANDLADILDAIDARDAIVAGHSMGGMAVQAFAVQHPQTVRDRVAALVIVSSACDGMSKVNRVTGPFTGLPLTDRVLAITALAPFLVRKSTGRRAHLGHLHAIRDLFVATPPEVRRTLRAAMNRMDFSAQLVNLDIPVLVVAGRCDRITPFARSQRIAEICETAELHAFDELGHMLPWEAPDELAEVLASAPTATGAAT